MLPMANSSILVFPTITAPAFCRFLTASAVNVGRKLESIFELHVVSCPSIHMLSLTAAGTPARGPVNSSLSIRFCTDSACISAPASSSVT